MNVYRADHRQWGDDFAYHDIDGVEWTGVNGKWYPVAVVEECAKANEREDVRRWTLPRYQELAEALTSHYGYRIHAYFVRWSADESKPEGERVQSLDVRCLTSGKEVTFTRDGWVSYLRLLRNRVQQRIAGL